MLEKSTLRWEDGRLIIEVQAVIRIPIMLQPITQEAADVPYLTSRERQALDGILKGLCNKDIAREVGVGERTVKFYVSALLEKFRVRTRGELAAMFLTVHKGEKQNADPST
jgi:DNA-binding NarL/FixJ family response regulator